MNVFDCTGLNENGLDGGVKIYPNPTNGYLYFELKSAAKIILYSETGQILLDLNLKDGKQSIDLSRFEAGIYFIGVIQKVPFTEIPQKGTKCPSNISLAL